MGHQPTPEEQAWIDGSSDPAKARPCVLLAAAFNLLDESLLAPILTEGCVYESQSAIEPRLGRP